ncbi:putative receptor-like protein kinase, partial [Mucuna pruriens]
MTKLQMEKHITLFLPLLITILTPIAASSSCPMNLTYVKTFPWNTWPCRDPINKQLCCVTLNAIFKIGLAQHLKQTSFFQLPNENASSTCLSDFQATLTTLSIHPSLIPSCFPNASQFVTNSSTCAGIVTTQDWEQKVGLLSPLHTYCGKDLHDQTRCSNCIAAGLTVAFQLASVNSNATDTECFSFASLFAAAVVNPQGTTDVTTIGCVLSVPLSSNAVTKGSSNKRGKVTKLVSALLGGVVGVVLAFVLMVVYRKWDKRRKERLYVYHREIENEVRASSVLANADPKWFHISELERATSKFSSRNVVGQGGDGVVYKGKLSDGTLVAVKEIFNLESKGDEEFCYEVEIISKIKHRNLLQLRGCCISSDDLKDFGLAKEHSEDESTLTTTRVAGTYGYVAPEYALYGQLTDKSDVYSFGIVILEIMSGRKVFDTLNSSADSIADWVWTLVESGKMEEVFDESIREGQEKIMERFVHVGMLCAHVVVALRPTIVEALKMLEGDIDIPKLPHRPVPLGHASFQSSLLECSG